jgi:hypothetical protein
MNVERLKLAIRIIERIPDSRVALSYWQQGADEGDLAVQTMDAADHCGTIACAGGWLALAPEMQERGLRPSVILGAPTLGSLRSYAALASFFDIGHTEADQLFGPRAAHESFPDSPASDREVWLSRARKLLEETNEEKLD